MFLAIYKSRILQERNMLKKLFFQKKVILLLLGVLVFRYFTLSSSFFHWSTVNKAQVYYSDVLHKTCNIPHLQLWPAEMKHLFSRTEPSLKCADEDWVYIEHGVYRFSKAALRKHGEIKCTAFELERKGDFQTVRKDEERPLKDGDPLLSDFSDVHCVSATDPANKFRTVFPGIVRVKNGSGSHEQKIEADHLNILIFGFDSVSRMTFMRELPKTYKYLTAQLGAQVLKGYNIVGDGTPAALLPILTGQDEESLPEARRGHPNAKPVDGHPWIWKDLHRLGYVTQYGEDAADINAFTYRMLGFDKQPTHHYMRPFYLYSRKLHGQNKPYCLGSVPRHINMFNWVVELYRTYQNVPKFSFLFHSEYSHGKYGELRKADIDLQQFLENMTRWGYLNKTVLVLMSDHGARYSQTRATVQGKYEERMPFFSLRFPDWFEKKHENAMSNLKKNIHTLTTPYDIHQTLLNIVNISQHTSHTFQSHKARSLLQEIAPDRNCSAAGVSAHWCVCLTSQAVNTSDVDIQSAAAHLTAAINGFTASHRQQCSKLKLSKVMFAVILNPDELVMRYVRSRDVDGRVPKFASEIRNRHRFLQIVVETMPGRARFEATLRQMFQGGQNVTYSVSSKDISRINKYGNQPKCVQDEFPHLRQYCYCTDHVA